MISTEVVWIVGVGSIIWIMVKALRREFKKMDEDMLREKEIEKMERICKNCRWYDRGGMCCLDPKKVAKMPDDFCSHWTVKQLNEVQQLINETKP